MNSILVTCAIIEQDGKILCAQRSATMKHPLKWEFPGGKVEEAESPETCLQRERREELNVEIEILEKLQLFSHSYSNGSNITLFPFRCKITGGKVKLAEHKQINWLKPEYLRTLDWVEADIAVVNFYLSNAGKSL